MHKPLCLLGGLAALALQPWLASADDRNGNGLDDALEEALLARFAPLVLLEPRERAMPANVDWYLARAQLEPDLRPEVHVTQASLLGNWDAALRTLGREVARLRPNHAARPGSPDPRDWIVYGHVYPAQDGGVLVQYWFFYPFNDFLAVFNHEGDWEHVTVRLDRALRPVGAWYARHRRSAPGKWFAWNDLAREGDHPVALSARGSHASYAEHDEVPWYDRVCATRVPADAERLDCVVWRTWAKGTGGIVNTGPRRRPRPRAWFVSWPGEWGTEGWFGRDTGGPLGPAYQEGWCSGGAPGCS